MHDWSEWNPRDIERLISPMRWIPTSDKQQAVDDHIAAAVLETSKAREEIPCKLDIPYGPNESERLDIYGTDLDDTSPVFVWVHGGGWLTGDRNWSGFFIRNLHSWGFRSVVVGYLLAPEATIREMCIQIRKAVEKAIHLFPKAKFVIGGHSAGAQLIANLLCGDSPISQNQEVVNRISGFLFVSGLFDIRTIQNTIVNEALQLTTEEAKQLSPLLNTDKIHRCWFKRETPLKVLVAVGQFDPPEFQRQAKVLAEGLLNQGILNTSIWVSHDDDHFTVVQNFSRPDSPSGKKLKEYLLFATNSHLQSKI